MREYSINKYLQDLASDKPVPGGGTSSALAGALGAALMEKVCNFTVGREKYKSAEKDIIQILKKATLARKRLVQLIELDKRAFLPVVKAYKLPKDTDEQKAARKDRIKQAGKEASKVPQEIMQICSEVMVYCDKLEKEGNQLFVSDIRCARELLKAAGSAAGNFV